MQIYLQRKGTKEFFVSAGKWSEDRQKALSFASSLEALDFCLYTKLQDIQLLFVFEDEQFNFTLPVSDTAEHEPRSEFALHLADFLAKALRRKRTTNNPDSEA